MPGTRIVLQSGQSLFHDTATRDGLGDAATDGANNNPGTDLHAPIDTE